MTGLTRTLYSQDNRNNTMKFIQITITRSFEILETYKHSKKYSDKIMCDNLIYDLKHSKEGLKNLKTTYEADIKFCCDTDLIIQNIEANISEIEGKLKNDDDYDEGEDDEDDKDDKDDKDEDEDDDNK